MGGRCKNEQLEPFVLKNVRRTKSRQRAKVEGLQECLQAKAKLTDQLAQAKHISQQMQCKLPHAHVLTEFIQTKSVAARLGLKHALSNWLKPTHL